MDTPTRPEPTTASAPIPPMSRLARRLKRRLEAEGIDMPSHIVIDRTHAGRHQRAQDAWSWQLATIRDDGVLNLINLGSQYTATEVASAARLSFWNDGWDLHVFVEEPIGKGPTGATAEPDWRGPAWRRLWESPRTVVEVRPRNVPQTVREARRLAGRSGRKYRSHQGAGPG